jgi:putative transposase
MRKAMPKKVKLTRAVSVEELEDRYRKEANPRVKERLLVLIHLCEGQSAVFTSQSVKCSKRSITRWVKAYNEKGYEGLIPKFTGGPKPTLTANVWNEILAEIDNKGLTIKDVAVYIKNSRGVTYKYNTLWKILRKKYHVKYGKPYKVNTKRPNDAEAILKKD